MQKIIYYCDKTGEELPDKQEMRIPIGSSFDGVETTTDYFTGNFSFNALKYAIEQYFKNQDYNTCLKFISYLKNKGE